MGFFKIFFSNELIWKHIEIGGRESREKVDKITRESKRNERKEEWKEDKRRIGKRIEKRT